MLRNSTTFHNFNNIYSKKGIFIERYVKQSTLRDFTMGTMIPNDAWMQRTIIKGKVQQEAICILYSNIHNTDYTHLSFKTEVYGVWMLIN